MEGLLGKPPPMTEEEIIKMMMMQGLLGPVAPQPQQAPPLQDVQNMLRQFVNPDKRHNPTPGRPIPLSTVGVRG